MVKKKNKKSDSIVKEPNVYNRTEADVIIIHTDSLKLKLRKYEDSVKYGGFFFSSIGVIITIILVLATADFKDFLGFSSHSWRAFFLFILVASVFFAIFSLVKSIKNRTSIDKIVEGFKDDNSLTP